MAENKVEIDVVAETAGATAALNAMGEKLKDLSTPVREVLEAAGQLRKTLVEAFVIKEVAELVEHVTELGEQAIRSSQMLGMSVQQVQELGFAARMVGGSSESMTMALVRLERNMAEGREGAGKAAQAFQALGISQADLKNKSPHDVLMLIADAFMNAKDGADKTAIAMDLLGRQGAQMIPELNKGSAGFAEMARQAKLAGVDMKELQAEGLEKTHQSITFLKESVEGVGISLVELLHPAIDLIINVLTSLVVAIRVVIDSFRMVIKEIQAGVLIAIDSLITSFEMLRTLAVGYVKVIEIEFQTLAKVIDDVVHLHFEQAKDDFITGLRQVGQQTVQTTTDVAHLGGDFLDLAAKIQHAADAALKFDDSLKKEKDLKNLHAPTGKGGAEDKTEEQIEKNDLVTELEHNKLLITAQKDKDQALVDSGKMSRAQQLADLKSFTSQEWELNMKALDDEADLYDEDTAQYHAILNKKRIMTDQYNNDIAKLNLESLKDQESHWKAFFNSMDSAMNQMVNGILQGTQTWQQAMGKMFDNLLIKFIDDFVVKAVEDWIQSCLKQVAATDAKNVAIVASDQAANAASSESMIAKAVTAIVSDAKQVFGGVFAFLSPEMGPAAGIPAAASAAAVTSFSPNISAAVGVWELDNDLVAQLHKGEMVVPQTFAEGLRSNGSNALAGGGDTYNVTFSVQALDSQSVSQLFKSQGPVLAQMMAQQMRQFNPKTKM